MKKTAALAFFALGMATPALANPITAINITLPTNPDSNTTNWGTGTSFTITVSDTLAKDGKVDPSIADSKILVIIKKDGKKFCGGAGSAAGFTSATKVWSGSNAAALLGSCTLPQGEYALSVQFLSGKAGATLPVSDEVTRTFLVKQGGGTLALNPAYLAPKLTSLNPNDLEDIKKPIAFRWTPVIPAPTAPVTYRLAVWEVLPGQTGPQGIKANQPILTKDVDNLTSASVVLPSCGSGKACSYVWTVQALDRDSKPIGNNNGTSKASTIVVGYGTQK